MSFRPRNRKPWDESKPLDVTYDREQRRTEAFETKALPHIKPKGDDFDLFCKRQKDRLARRLDAIVRRTVGRYENDNEEQFESRK